jgi:hypothetical protein
VGLKVCAWLVPAVMLAAVASAQPQHAQVYIQGGLTLNDQDGDSGTTPETYVTAPGGTTLGWLAGGGVQIGGRGSIGVEWSSTGTMKATEPSRYFTTYIEERRDRFLIVEGRIVLGASRIVAVEPMVGLALTFPEASSRAVYTDPTFPRPDQPVIHHRLDVGIGPAFGADVRIGGRVAVVPSFRIIRSAIAGGRYDETSDVATDIESIYPGGYPKWTTRGAVAVRIGL